MRLHRNLSLLAIVLLAGFGALARSDDGKDQVKEEALDAPNKVKLRVRMEGPYTADVPLQVVCYFKYTREGAKRMSGAKATRLTPSRAASRSDTLPTASIRFSDRASSSPSPTRSSAFALIASLGGVMRSVSSWSPTNSPRSRREPITPPSRLSNSTGAPLILSALSAVYLK